jgi:hypothetical protein
MREDDRDAGNATKRRLNRWNAGLPLWALRVRGPIPPLRSLASLGEAMKPQGGVSCVHRSEQRHSQVGDGDADTSDRRRGERSVIQLHPLDKKVRSSSCSSQPAELRPEAPVEDRCVQTAHRLSLDDGSAADRVVAGSKRPNLDFETGLPQETWHPARPFVHVGDDSQSQTVAHDAPPSCHEREPNRTLLALSRSESA